MRIDKNNLNAVKALVDCCRKLYKDIPKNQWYTLLALFYKIQTELWRRE
jgi:hypothetical protein